MYWANSINSGMRGPGDKNSKKATNDVKIKHLTNPGMISTVVTGGETASVWFIADFMSGMPVSIDAWR